VGIAAERSPSIRSAQTQHFSRPILLLLLLLLLMVLIGMIIIVISTTIIIIIKFMKLKRYCYYIVLRFIVVIC